MKGDRSLLLLVLGLALPVAIVLMGAEAPAPTLKKDVQPIFDESCTGCHGAAHQRAKLNLSPATAATALVGVASSEVPQLVRVKPGDPEASYLWQKLQHTAAQGKGMPRGIFTSKRLPEAQLDIIKRWILAGAPE